jgi:N-acetylneuraminic acid mutarotase
MDGAPSARTGQSAVWTGQEMIIWGGTGRSVPDNALGLVNLADGAAFNPATNTWRALASIGAPSTRTQHAAVWTGREMIVWGGITGSYGLDGDGAAYDPITDTWRPLPSAGAPSPRRSPAAVWTGSEMVILDGGYPDGSQVPQPGGRYDPVANQWTPLRAEPVAPRTVGRRTAAVWTGSAIVAGDGGQWKPDS